MKTAISTAMKWALPSSFTASALAVAAPQSSAIAQGGAPSRATPFTCQVRSIHDGDTFRCYDGTRIQLAGVDAPEMPGACTPGRHCAPGNPYGSRDYLSQLIMGRTLVCSPTGRSYNRVVANCTIGGRDLSCAMLQARMAIYLDRYDRAGRLARCVR